MTSAPGEKRPPHPEPSGGAPPPVRPATAALGGLGIVDTAEEPDTDELVALVAAATGASCVSLTFLDGPRAWSKATTAPCGQVEVPAAGSLAARAVAAAPAVVREAVGDDHPLRAHPAFGAPGDPRRAVTSAAAVAVHAPDGTPVGALELAWDGASPDQRPPGQDALLRRFASHTGRLLELRSDVAAHVVRDLASRIRDEEERTRLSEQLARAQRLDAVGQIAGGLAHDLNNLLVVMVSNLALAKESLGELPAPSAGEDLERDLDELELAVDRATNLTANLLAFARREPGAGAEAHVEEVVDGVRQLLGRSLGAGVRLSLDVAGELPPVTVDPVQLERALVNLVINGRDALDGGGRITVRARVLDTEGPLPVDLGPARVPRLDGRRLVRIDVEDDGRGMDAEVQARAFEPLFTTKGDRGNGLGLSTVAALADEVDGSVTIASEPGSGTRVTLLLHAAEPMVAPVLPDPDALVAGARLLVVEPGERTRTVIATMLAGAGYQVRTVRTAEDALDDLATTPADLALVELSLPGLSGRRLIDRLRAERPEQRAIAMSSVDAPETVSGAPTLVKPFSHARLLRAVERALTDEPATPATP